MPRGRCVRLTASAFLFFPSVALERGARAGQEGVCAVQWSSRSEMFATLNKMVPNAKFLGAAFWVGYLLVLYGCEVNFYGIGLDSDAVSAIYVASNAFFALTLVLAGAGHKVVHRWLQSNWFVFSMGLLASVGTVLLFVLQLAGGLWYLTGAALIGVGTAFVAAKSMLQVAELGPREVIFMAALVQICGMALDYTVLSISWMVQPWLFFLMPALAAVFLLIESAEDRPEMPEDSWQPPSWLWRFVLGVLVFAIPDSICRACFPLFYENAGLLVDYRRLSGFLIIVFMAAMAILALRLPKNAKFGALVYGIILSVSFVYVALSLVGPQSGAVMAVSGGVNALVSLCVWVLIARIGFMSGTSVVRVFGFGYASYTVGGTLGWAVALAATLFGLTLEGVLAVMVASAVAMLVVALFLFRRKDLVEMMRPVGESEEEQGGSPLGLSCASCPSAQGSANDLLASCAACSALPHVQDAEAQEYAAWRRLCALAAQNAQLSLREVEVFDGLVRGLSARAISDSLCISYNTTRNHIQHIYTKCGIHSKDELQDYIRSFDTSVN